MTPTKEQLEIVEAAKTTKDNLLISALAGAAKTTTLVMLSEALPDTQMLCLAFNKRIAVEMQRRLPDNCTAKTLNSLGHTAWADTLGKKLRLNESKNYEIVKKLVDSYDQDLKQQLYADFSYLTQSVAQGKTAGYIPNSFKTPGKRLLDDDEFFNWLETEPTPLQWDVIRKASLISLERAFQGEIDFNDQILMPTVFSAVFPYFPLVLIDEAQDLSELNHAMLRKVAKKRLIAVGDECQAIYGFRGAHQNSMGVLAETFKMRRLFLTTTFRCPIKVVEEARWRAPAMQWASWAEQGHVDRFTTWSEVDIPEHAAILCRNNAPLFDMAIKFLQRKRRVTIVGNDIGLSLVKLMKKIIKDKDQSQAEFLETIRQWEEDELKKSRAKKTVQDKAQCMRVFANVTTSAKDAIAYLEHLINSQGSVQMSTVHKSKGLEYDHVYLLDPGLIRTEEDQQEQNLMYVAQTRAKKGLTYMESSGFLLDNTVVSNNVDN